MAFGSFWGIHGRGGSSLDVLSEHGHLSVHAEHTVLLQVLHIPGDVGLNSQESLVKQSVYLHIFEGSGS